MEQRISLITLGVRDMLLSRQFYDALGWRRVESQDGVIVYDLIGQSLGLYPLEKLAEDIGIDLAEMGVGRSTLGYNCRDRQEVERIIELAEEAGARVLKSPAEVFWGGYVGYFEDLDGHIWEVTHNPLSPLRGADGAFRWKGYN